MAGLGGEQFGDVSAAALQAIYAATELKPARAAFPAMLMQTLYPSRIRPPSPGLVPVMASIIHMQITIRGCTINLSLSALVGRPCWWRDALLGGGLLHVDTFAQNKSGIAYQSKSR
jgi:hypothetical protein